MTKFPRPSAALQLFSRVAFIPGFFNYDDAQHFSLIFGIQAASGVKGDLMEIGTWKGRSAAFLASFLGENDRLVLNDVFSAPATDKYSEYPSVASVRENILVVCPMVENQLVFIEGDSRTTTVDSSYKFRFIHIDGGHSFAECYADLIRVSPFVIVGGVIAVDDYDHQDWPEVKPAADQWLAENDKFAMVGDMNRAVAKGRKLYLMRCSA
jgi:predicted O-methyltransferase YrrM